MNTKKFASKIISISMAAIALAFAGCSKKTSETKTDAPKTNTENPRLKEVVVYAYDSFAGEWGPGPELTKIFNESSGYTLTLVDCGDAVQAFNRAVLEKDNVQADVIIGIDNSLASKAREAGILEAYEPKDARKIIPSNVQDELGNDFLLTAYDYGHFAMIYDSQSSVAAPASLNDLTKDIYRKKIILMDPRTSTPGLGFVAWTVAVFGDRYLDFWKELEPNILTMTSGWSEGWGMFQEGEAPLCISYTTSPAYNVEYENNDRYKTILFDEGHVEQVEGYGLLKNAPNPEGAKVFMDFLISKEAQTTLPLTQWMYPVNSEIVLPQSYATAAPLPKKTLATDSNATQNAVDKIIEQLSLNK
jgi:thiamine transport system substrate-binding protein